MRQQEKALARQISEKQRLQENQRDLLLETKEQVNSHLELLRRKEELTRLLELKRQEIQKEEAMLQEARETRRLEEEMREEKIKRLRQSDDERVKALKERLKQQQEAEIRSQQEEKARREEREAKEQQRLLKIREEGSRLLSELEASRSQPLEAKRERFEITVENFKGQNSRMDCIEVPRPVKSPKTFDQQVIARVNSRANDAIRKTLQKQDEERQREETEKSKIRQRMDVLMAKCASSHNKEIFTDSHLETIFKDFMVQKHFGVSAGEKVQWEFGPGALRAIQRAASPKSSHRVSSIERFGKSVQDKMSTTEKPQVMQQSQEIDESQVTEEKSIEQLSASDHPEITEPNESNETEQSMSLSNIDLQQYIAEQEVFLRNLGKEHEDIRNDVRELERPEEDIRVGPYNRSRDRGSSNSDSEDSDNQGRELEEIEEQSEKESDVSHEEVVKIKDFVRNSNPTKLKEQMRDVSFSSDSSSEDEPEYLPKIVLQKSKADQQRLTKETLSESGKQVSPFQKKDSRLSGSHVMDTGHVEEDRKEEDVDKKDLKERSKDELRKLADKRKNYKPPLPVKSKNHKIKN